LSRRVVSGIFFGIFAGIAFLMADAAFAQNANISNGSVFDGEPCMAIDPVNPHHVVVAWMGYQPGFLLSIKTIVSFNGGRTWSSPVLLPHFSPSFHSADPSLAFDNKGNLYACYIDYQEAPDNGGIYLVKSADGGLTWNFTSKILDAGADGSKKPIDRPWLCINPVNNHLYVTSKPAPWVAPPNRPYFTASSDQGLTWGAWRYIDGPGYLVGGYIKAPMAAPTVSSDGVFHCLYPSWVVSQNILPGFIHAESADDGAGFTYHGALYSNTGITDTLAKAGGHLAADPVNPHHLAFVFLNSTFGDLDVFFSESPDGGVSWSSPLRLNSDPRRNGKMQDLVWSSFDATGNFVAAWRDRRNSPGTGYAEASEIWGTMRWKDSTGFSANFRISDTLSAYHDVLSQNGNDFMALEVAGDTVHAAWGDTRNGFLNIWYSVKNLHDLNTNGIRNIVHELLPAVEVFPNPGGSRFRLKGSRVMAVEVYDLRGNLIMEKNSAGIITEIDLSASPPGVYIAVLRTIFGELQTRLVRE